MKISEFTSVFVLSLFSLARSHPLHDSPRELNIVGVKLSRRQTNEPATTTVPANSTSTGGNIVPPEMQLLADGNAGFRERHNQTTPTLLRVLTDEGQAPPFMFLGCSDSRVSEGTVFDAQPGTLFTARNIANQFHTGDSNTNAVLAYAVTALGVRHVVVMGHYGCGGVGAAITPPPPSPDAATGVVQTWINPIRELFQTSTRPEIVELRQRIEGQSVVEAPGFDDPGFRALVEENVKAGVRRIASESLIADRFGTSGSSNATSTSPNGETGATTEDLFIHGWVYDISSGEVHDLGVSVGPPGRPIPATPFSGVTSAAAPVTTPSPRSLRVRNGSM